jgi:hypothetical protein
MNKLTDIVQKTDSSCGLRATCQKFGFPEDEDIVITFKSQDKEVQTEPLTLSSRSQSSTLNAPDLNTAVLDWLNQAEKEYQLSSEISKELGLPKEGDVEITIQITSKSNEFVLSRIKYYCPCPVPPPFPPGCCWR